MKALPIVIGIALIGVSVYFVSLIKERDIHVDSMDKIVIYSAGQLHQLNSADNSFLTIKKEIEKLASVTNNKYLSTSGGQSFDNKLFADSKNNDYAIELIYNSPHRIKIGYQDPVAQENIREIFVSFSGEIPGICFNEHTCLQTTGEDVLLNLVDSVEPNFLPGIPLIPFTDSRIVGRIPYKTCKYENSQALCGALIVSMAEDVTKAELNNISDVVAMSKGRVVWTSPGLRTFEIEFYNDSDLFEFKGNITKIQGVVNAYYNLILSPL